MNKKWSKNVQVVLDILQDEVNGDVKSAMEKMTDDYTMTWAEAKGKEPFPTTKKSMEEELEEVYPIKDREYDIRNIAEGNNLVIVELIESYPDPKTKKVYRTPLVLVLEMKDGKIRTGRHYMDSTISYKYLTKNQVEKLYKNNSKSLLVIK